MNLREKILQTIDLHKLALHCGARHKQGSTYFCFLPDNHKRGDKSASMTISQGKESTRFICGGCKVAGDAVNMAMARYTLNYRDALNWLSEWLSLDPDEYEIETRVYFPKPVNTDYPEISVERAEIFREIWNLVKPLRKYNEEQEEWAYSRGVKYTAMAWHGCIDASEFLRVSHSLLMDLDNKERLESGFWSKDYKFFYPLLKKVPGVMIPQYHPKYNFPISYRFRKYQSGKGLKSISMYGSLGSLPFGIRNECDSLCDLKDAKTVLIVEGEPDYLSTLDVLIQLGLNRSVGVLGIAGTYWRHYYNRLLGKSSKIFLLTHIDKHQPEVAKDFEKSIVNSLRKTNGTMSSKKLKRITVYGDNDLNDLHQAGELIELLERILR